MAPNLTIDSQHVQYKTASKLWPHRLTIACSDYTTPRNPNQVNLAEETCIASVDSEDKVQKVMTKFLASERNNKIQNSYQIYQKLNLQQKSMFNRMRFVELDTSTRKKEALKSAYELA